MITKEILLPPRGAAKVIDLFETHDLPLNIVKGKNHKTNDTAGTVLSELTVEYDETDELLVDWLISKAEE